MNLIYYPLNLALFVFFLSTNNSTSTLTGRNRFIATPENKRTTKAKKE